MLIRKSLRTWAVLLVLLFIGWAPLSVADYLYLRRHYGVSESFGDAWGFGVALPCTYLAVVLALFFATSDAMRLLVRFWRNL
jgi:hypothetical protein